MNVNCIIIKTRYVIHMQFIIVSLNISGFSVSNQYTPSTTTIYKTNCLLWLHVTPMTLTFYAIVILCPFGKFVILRFWTTNTYFRKRVIAFCLWFSQSFTILIIKNKLFTCHSHQYYPLSQCFTILSQTCACDSPWPI